MDTKNDIWLLDRLAGATLGVALDGYNSRFGMRGDFLTPGDLRPAFEWCRSVIDSPSGREIDDLPGRVDYERLISNVSEASAALLGVALNLATTLNRYRQGHGLCYDYRKDLFVPQVAQAIDDVARAAYDLGCRDTQRRVNNGKTE